MKSTGCRMVRIAAVDGPWVAIYEKAEEITKLPIAVWGTDADGIVCGVVAWNGTLMAAPLAAEGFCGYDLEERRSPTINVNVLEDE